MKLLTPFIEMSKIEKHPDLIKEMYTTISEVFDGEIGFQDEGANILNGTSLVNSVPIRTVETYRQLERRLIGNDGTFWDWKDSRERPMRIEHSCWTPRLEAQRDQRASVMAHNFVKFWRPAIAYYSSTYPHNPEMFAELGVRNADGVCLGPAYYDITDKRLDREEVADIWYAYLKGANELGIRSINVWVIGLGDLWVMDCPGDSFINIGLKQPESPAYRIIKAIITPEEE